MGVSGLLILILPLIILVVIPVRILFLLWLIVEAEIVLERMAAIDVVQDDGNLVGLVEVGSDPIRFSKGLVLAILGHVREFDFLLLELTLVALALGVRARDRLLTLEDVEEGWNLLVGVHSANLARVAMLLDLSYALTSHVQSVVLPIDCSAHDCLNMLLLDAVFESERVSQHLVGEELVRLLESDTNIDMTWLDEGLLDLQRGDKLEDLPVLFLNVLLQRGALEDYVRPEVADSLRADKMLHVLRLIWLLFILFGGAPLAFLPFFESFLLLVCLHCRAFLLVVREELTVIGDFARDDLVSQLQDLCSLVPEGYLCVVALPVAVLTEPSQFI